MKLAIGTVQFGIPYGINNQSGIPSDEEIANIFLLAKKSGISFLDTSPAYGNAEEKIGALSGNSFNVVTKFYLGEGRDELGGQLKKSLFNLQQATVYGFIAHNADNLITQPALWDLLETFKAQGTVKKTGYSIYATTQLENLLTLGMIPDLVQLPYSILDRKFEPYLQQLKDAGTEIHIRSVFLQGLYFMDIDKLPAKLLPLKPALKNLHDNCDSKGVSVAAAALNFIAGNELIDHVVIGVDNVHQLKENIQMIDTWKANEELKQSLLELKVTDVGLLNPANW